MPFTADTWSSPAIGTDGTIYIGSSRRYDENLELGDETVRGKFTVTVDLSGFEGLTTVKYIVDGQLIVTTQESPYDADLFASQFLKGQHNLVVEVSDANSFNTDSIVFRR